MPFFTDFNGSAFFGTAMSGTVLTVPDAPIIGTATVLSSTSISISYTAPTNTGGSPITSYTAVSTPGGITATASQSGSGSITVTGLTAGTAYTFVIYATNSVGNSVNSSSSSSVTTTAAWWNASFTGTYYTLGLSVLDSGEIMTLSQNSSTNSTTVVLNQRTNAGAISWSKTNIPNTYNFISGIAKERNNTTATTASTIYTVITGDGSTTTYTNKAYVMKMNTSGTIAWQKYVSISGGAYFVNWNSSISADHTGIAMISAGGVLHKFNSSGNTALFKVASGLTMAYGRCVCQRESNTYFVIDHWQAGGAQGGGVVFKVDSTGALLWKQIVMPPNATTYVVYDGIDVDTSENVYISGRCSYLTNGSTLVKLTSSGAFSWGKTISNVNILSVHYAKAQNAIYVGGQTGGTTPAVFKFDLSGNLLWQRKYTGVTASSSGIYLDTKVDDANFFYMIPRGSGGVVMKLPSDGSVIGTGGVTAGTSTISSFNPTITTSGSITLGSSSAVIGNPSTTMNSTTLTQTLNTY